MGAWRIRLETHAGVVVGAVVAVGLLVLAAATFAFTGLGDVVRSGPTDGAAATTTAKPAGPTVTVQPGAFESDRLERLAGDRDAPPACREAARRTLDAPPPGRVLVPSGERLADLATLAKCP